MGNSSIHIWDLISSILFPWGCRMTFGDKLRALRKAQGWPQTELATRAGVPQSSLARWEAGQQTPPFDAVQALCAALGVSCSAFDGCEFAESAQKHPRGRPEKAAPKKPGRGRPKKS